MALMVAGLFLLLYVGTQYSQMYLKQRSLEREWLAQQETKVERSGPTANEIAQAGLTRLLIPKIGLSAIVVEGTNHAALKVGPGHLEGSALAGNPGNAVITAHRDTFFRHIVELKKGDPILVQRNGRSFTYEVTGQEIVEPDDLAVAEPTSDNRLTLITCYPTYYIGPAPKRLIVTAKLIGEPGQNVAKAAASTSIGKTLPGDR